MQPGPDGAVSIAGRRNNKKRGGEGSHRRVRKRRACPPDRPAGTLLTCNPILPGSALVLLPSAGQSYTASRWQSLAPPRALFSPDDRVSPVFLLMLPRESQSFGSLPTRGGRGGPWSPQGLRREAGQVLSSAAGGRRLRAARDLEVLSVS